jgi:hypothetical protein
LKDGASFQRTQQDAEIGRACVKHCTLRAMNPRHLALVFVVAWMGCSTNEAIDASSTPVDAFDASTTDANNDASTTDANNDASTTDANNDASTIDANNDASTIDANNDASTIDANAIDAGMPDVGFSESDANADAHIGPMDTGMSTVDLDASTTDANTTDASTTDDANTNDANVDCGMRGPARAAGCDTVE